MNRKNLIKAIEWHENKKGRKWFDFSAVVGKWDDKNKCGTVGCFMGNLPHIFPKRVRWLNNNSVQTKKNMLGDEVSAEMFGLHESVTNNLFYAGRQGWIHSSLKTLSENCTPKALCKELRKFIKLVDDGILNKDGTQK